MKRILSAVLALAMMMSLATVAFADNTVVDVTMEYDLYAKDADGRISSSSTGYTPTASGVTYYIPVTTKIETDNGMKTKNTVSTGYMRNYRLRLDASQSSNLVTGVTWSVAEGSDYSNSMYVAVATAPNKTNKTIEATFTITLEVKDTADAYIEGSATTQDYEYTLYLQPSTGTPTKPDSTATPQPNTGSGIARPTTPTAPAAPSATQGTSVLSTDSVKSAVAVAKQNGRTRADISLKNATGITVTDFKSVILAAQTAGGSLRIIADTTATNGAFLGRLYLAPTATAVTKDISFGVDPTTGTSTKATFENYYNNTVAVVRLAQDDTYGFAVEVAAKPDLTGLDKTKLMFYSYNRTTGKYYPISGANFSFDNSGFLHFTTTLAGDIIITDKALTAK